MMRADHAATILVGALGGQGGGVLAEWLVDAAAHAGYVAQSTSIPGVAQRTGATTYYIEIHPEPIASLGDRRPVLSLVPVPGYIDVLVASELLEGARMVGAAMASRDRTWVIASTSRTLTTAEKMALGDGRFASDRLLAVLREHARRLVAFDMDDVARRAGTIVSAVMFGAIAASGRLPFRRDTCEDAIRASGVGVEGSLRGFAAGFDAAAQAESVANLADSLSSPSVDATPDPVPPSANVTPDPAPPLGALPERAREYAAIGHARLVAYQDAGYGRLYLDRLERIASAERTIDPREGHAGALTRETARYLALWMAFDDIVRVAVLKCRASRFARVRREVAAGEHDIVRIVDYFKPGVPELAGLLPPSLARRAVAFDRRRQLRGKSPLALPLHVRADGIGGFLALRTLAALKSVRRYGARYADEQAAIERWLEAIVAAAATDWQTGYEIALSGRLIKGYGETNERGKASLGHIVEHLAAPVGSGAGSGRAAAIRAAREAALADEGGVALNQVLAAHGVPPRPAKAQPVVWVRKPARVGKGKAV